MTISQKTVFTICVCLLMFINACAPGLKGQFKIAPNASINSELHVAVMPFAVSSNLDPDVGEKFAHSIGTELIPYYQMVERDQITKLLNELGFSAGGVVDEKTLPKLGEILGVKAAILGRIFRCEKIFKAGTPKYCISANLRMVDIQSSAVLWSINCELEHGAKSIYDFGNIFAKKFAEKLRKELQGK